MTLAEARKRTAVGWAYAAALQNEPVVTSLRKPHHDERAAEITLAHLKQNGFAVVVRRKKKRR